MITNLRGTQLDKTLPMMGGKFDVYFEGSSELDERFIDSDLNGWFLSSSNVNISYNPLGIEFLGGLATYQVSKATALLLTDSIGVRVGYSIDLNVGGLGVSESVFTAISLDTGTVQAIVGIRANSSTGVLRAYIEVDDGSGFFDQEIEIDSASGFIQLAYAQNKIDAYVMEPSGFKLIGSTTFTPDGIIDVFVGGATLDSPGSVIVKYINTFPVVVGIPADDRNFGSVYASKSGELITYSAHPTFPCQCELVARYLSDSISVGTLSFEPKRANFNQCNMMVSQVERFYDDGAGSLVCPLFADPDDSNIGNSVVLNRCFDDGSARSSDPVYIKSIKQGTFNQNGNRLDSPQFLIEDSDGNTYGESFEWNRVHGVDVQSPLSNASERLIFTKTKILSDERRLVYGAAATPLTSSVDIFVQFEFDYSKAQDDDPGTDIDVFSWIIMNQDGEVIFDRGLFYKSDIEGASATDYTEYSATLPPGLYSVYIECRGDGSNYDFNPANSNLRGGRIRASVYQGTTSSDPFLGRGFAEPRYYLSSANRTILDFGYCYVNFSISERRGRLVFYLVDPSTQSMTLFESPSREVQLDTHSMSCVETEDGFVFFYQYASSDDIWENRSSSLRYIKWNGAFGTPGKLIFFHDTGMKWIHCFDSYQDDGVSFYIANADDKDFVVSDQDRRSIPYWPIGNSHLSYQRINIDGLSFDGQSYSVFTDDIALEQGVVSLNGFQDAFYRDTDGAFYDDKNGYKNLKFVFPHQISVNLDESSGVGCLTFLDANTKTPCVMVGTGERMKPVCVPMMFNMYQNWPFFTYLYQGRVNHALTSVSGVWCADGMIYVAASKGEVCELAQIDPELFWKNNRLLVEPDFDRDDSSYFYRPTFKTKCLTFYGVGIQYSSERFVRLSLSSQGNYLICNISDNNYSKYPLLMSNMHLDELPFECPDEMMWIPELAGNHQSFNVDAGVDNGYMYQIQNTVAGSSVYGLLDTDTTYRDKYFHNDIGYRFKARISVNDSLTEALEFYCIAQSNLDSPFYACQARWVVIGTTATTQVYDENAVAWVDVSSFDLQIGEVYDLYILTQSLSGSSKFRASFVAKRINHYIDLYDGTHSYDFSASLEHFSKISNVQGDSNYLDDKTEFGVYFRSNSTTDRPEYANVYYLGYCTLKADEGYYEEDVDDKGGDPIAVYNSMAFDGKSFREFDDSIVFDYTGTPQYNLRRFKLDSSDTTGETHWYNGFMFRFSSGDIFPFDRWTLARSFINDINELLSKRLHGFYATADDDGQVVIWADAQDSGLQRFYADTFVVKGVNFTAFEIVARNDSLDPWDVIESVSLKRWGCPEFSSVKNGNSIVVENASASFYDGIFVRPHQASDGSGSFLMKIYKSDTDKIFTYLNPKDSSASPSGESLEIFAQSRFVKINQPIEYRYIGFRISPQNTWDGFFTLHTLDFGFLTDLPIGPDAGSGKMQSSNIKSYFIQDNQIYNSKDRRIIHDFKVSYNLLQDSEYLTFLSILDKVSHNSYPVWLIPDSNDPFDLYLCLFNGDVQHGLAVDADQDPYFTQDGRRYSVSFNLREVGE